MRLTSEQAAEAQHVNKPLWCIYGNKFFPQIFACKISTATGTPTIWGYSEYKNSPKYRTLGLSLEVWTNQVMYSAGNVCEFYDVHDEAIDRIKKFTSVKKIKS